MWEAISVMSGKGLTPGHAEYFEREVAAGREDYFAGRGESPGVWRGSGAASAGLEGQVADGQLEALFNQVHPVTGELLGKPYSVSGSYIDRWGSVQPRHKQAAFDATFSVPKSVSELFAQLDPDRQALVVAAASAGNQAALDHLDRHAAFSRVGKGGARQVDTDGLVVASYMHRTSRAGDPQLHFHNLIANRVRCSGDGVWRAVDGRHVRAEQKAAGMVGQAAMRAELETSLGVEFGPVSKDGQAEVLGVPQGLMDAHSKRARQVKTHGAELITATEEKLQRSLTPTERAVKYREAALQTRTGKTKDMHAVEGLAERWQQEAAEAGFDPASWLSQVVNRPRTLDQARTVPDAELVDQALETLTETYSTWGRTHATRELARLVPHQLTTGEQVAVRVEALTDQLMVDERVLGITLTTPGPDQTLVRADGTSQYERHNTARYTTDLTLEREQEILDHAEQGRNAGIAVPHSASVEAAVENRMAEGRVLSTDQEAAVRQVVMSGDAVSVLVGPAGAGKSATLSVVADVYDDSGIPIRGLAPSAKAAAVLRSEAGIGNSDTLAKLLHENQRDGGPGPGYAIRSGEVIVLDEASMAATADLHSLVELARAAGAKIVAVGDYRQLGAVDAGGMFRLLANDTSSGGVSELDQVWRFTQPWERQASLQLRDGDTAVLEVYNELGRIKGGGRQELLDHAFTQWAAAREYDASVIVTAPDRATVTEFNTRARAHLQAAGMVGSETRPAGDIDIAIGDEILTLRNDRRLVASDGAAVRNGDRWTVQAHLDDGGMRVARLDEYNKPGAALALPASYLDAGHIDHAYATTVHKAQGVTVDYSYTLIDERTTAEAFYVGATRGRHLNQMLAVTDVELGDYDIDAPPLAPHDVLASALRRETAERSATELIRTQLEPDLGERIPGPPPTEHAPRIQTVDPQPASPQPKSLEPLEQSPVTEVERMVVTGPALAKTPQHAPTDRELTGEELRALQTRRVRLTQQLSDAEQRLGDVNQARHADQRDLQQLRDNKTWVQANDIDQSRQTIEQIRHRGIIGQLTTGPRERLDDRARINRLERRITDGYAKLRGLDIQITRQQTLIAEAEQGPTGRGREQHRHDQIRDYAQPQIGIIDQVLDRDLGMRTERIIDQGIEPGQLDRYRIQAPHLGTPANVIERWVGVVARADQHHTAWTGYTPADRSVDQRALGHSRQQLATTNSSIQNTLEPYRPHIHRPGPDLGLGISR